MVELPFSILIYADYMGRLHPCLLSDLFRDGYMTQARPIRAFLEPFSEISGKETESFVGIINCKAMALELPTAVFCHDIRRASLRMKSTQKKDEDGFLRTWVRFLNPAIPETL